MHVLVYPLLIFITHFPNSVKALVKIQLLHEWFPVCTSWWILIGKKCQYDETCFLITQSCIFKEKCILPASYNMKNFSKLLCTYSELCPWELPLWCSDGLSRWIQWHPVSEGCFEFWMFCWWPSFLMVHLERHRWRSKHVHPSLHYGRLRCCSRPMRSALPGHGQGNHVWSKLRKSIPFLVFPLSIILFKINR